MSKDFDLKGMEQIIQKLEKLADAAAYEKAMGQACALVEAEAKNKAPKDTGNLKNSIESKVDNTGTMVEGVVFSSAEYAPYVEYGTGLFAESGGRKDSWVYQAQDGNFYRTEGAAPQPFMRPALAENKEKIKEKLKEGFKNG